MQACLCGAHIHGVCMHSWRVDVEYDVCLCRCHGKRSGPAFTMIITAITASQYLLVVSHTARTAFLHLDIKEVLTMSMFFDIRRLSSITAVSIRD